MTVRVEKKGPVWTVIHSRPEARNAMDPDSADALTRAFLEFDADDESRVRCGVSPFVWRRRGLLRWLGPQVRQHAR